MNNVYHDEESVRKSILRKFGTYQKCAASLGITKQNLNSKIKSLSKKFIMELNYAGVLDTPNNFINEPDTEYGADRRYLSNNVETLQYQLLDCKKKLENVTKDKVKIIDLLENKVQTLEYEIAKLEGGIDA